MDRLGCVGVAYHAPPAGGYAPPWGGAPGVGVDTVVTAPPALPSPPLYAFKIPLLISSLDGGLGAKGSSKECPPTANGSDAGDP